MTEVRGMTDHNGKHEAGRKAVTGLSALMTAAGDGSVGYVAGVAGSPMTHVIQAFADESEKTDRFIARWFSNEKQAMENAVGTSVLGVRSLVLVKHVGMNVLSDPLVTAVTHTIGGGLVIIAGDDPDVSGSQNCQDSRHYGPVAGTVVYDPADVQDLYDFVRRAFDFSEEIRAPVIVRVTMDVLESEMDGGWPETSRGTAHPAEERRLYDKHSWDWTYRGKHQRFHLENDGKMQAESDRFGVVFGVSGKAADAPAKYGLIASGYAFSLAAEGLKAAGTDLPLFKTGVINPMPIASLREFCSGKKAVLVVEEPETYIEDQLRILGNVLGRRTGHLPFGKLTVEDVSDAISRLNQKSADVRTVPEKRSASGKKYCAGCLYPMIFDVLNRVKEKTGLPVAGDLGCLVGGAMPPYYMFDAAVSLGSGIGIGAGFCEFSRVCEKRGKPLPAVSDAAKRSIALVGDFGLAHSGLYGLVDAGEKKQDILVLVSGNGVAAMTGGQPSPDVDPVVRAIADEFIELHEDWGGLTPEILEKTIFGSLKNKGISVLSLRWRCRKYGNAGPPENGFSNTENGG